MTASTPHGITHRRVLGIALPILLANATVPILGVVDTGVVGQLGDPVPIGAVAIGANILTAIYWIFGFLRMGTTGMTSQALGAGDRGEADALLSRAMVVGVGGGLALILLQWPIFQGGFLISPASPAVEESANTYMSVRIWSAPAAIALYGINGWLIASERTRAVLALQVWMNGLNIVLDVAFVLGFGWGVAGVAFATFLAEWSGLALGLWFCRDAIQRPFWNDWPRILSRARLFRMAVIHRDILLRSLFVESIFVSFLFFGARFGDVPLAANQILLQFVHLTAHALDGFAIAAETLVGNAVGARNRARLRKGAVMASAWGAGVMVVFSVAVWAFGPWVIELMTTSDEVRRAAKALLPWMVAAPVLGIAAWMLDGIFIGATRTGDMRNMTAVSAAIYFVAVWALAGYGNDGLWMALLISLVARGVTLGIRYPALERAGG
ncbi:MAG: MATE family efflux transporter [Boseongicola sp. SB0677_bin_26]|nr:MATE family efflux transporter [Boseongicola sp. SB0665_bin_10]MYG25878.1 MATE family efflux transporter [Boseongicola sp. SB0677_bin_26]